MQIKKVKKEKNLKKKKIGKKKEEYFILAYI